MSPRRYESPRRQAQAAATQRAILDAARELVLTRGYGATSVSDVAKAAGVSAQTIYNSFGTKAALVKRVYDVTLAGDEEDVAVADRDFYRQIFARTDPVDFLEAWVHGNRVVTERVGPLIAVLAAGAAGGDEELRQFIATIDQERITGVAQFAERLAGLQALRAGVTVDHARDVIWSLTGPELYELLVTKRGWSAKAYEDWSVTMLRNTLLED